ncbi:MAG: hypothetical protein PQJ60_10900 [Spirochaetales bacterium]|nr:hypothetical protein [Spirochaetales bacterium]
MKSLKGFFEAHWKFVGLILLFAIFGANTLPLLKAVHPQLVTVSNEAISIAVGDVVEQKIFPLADQQKKQTLILEQQGKKIDELQDSFDLYMSYPILLIAKEVESFKTAREVDERINFLEDNCWNAQLAALEYLADNPESVQVLRTKIVYDEVFFAIKSHILRY